MKRILWEDKKKGIKKKLKTAKETSRPEVLRTTFRLYKILKSQILETLVLL